MTSRAVAQRHSWTLGTIVGRILGLGEVAEPRRKQQTTIETLAADVRWDEEVRKGPFSSHDLWSAQSGFHPV